jgi:hypothetical protein
MKIPASMKDELQSWNNGSGIDLEGWVGCTGNFALAVGYTTIFCPEFMEFEDYIFAGNEISKEFVINVRSFEKGEGSTPMSVEQVINHFHLADIQHRECADLSADKLIFLGSALKITYEARLHYQFPNKPCIVKFYKPEDREALEEYQISFWQKKHDQNYAM